MLMSWLFLFFYFYFPVHTSIFFIFSEVICLADSPVHFFLFFRVWWAGVH